jgi:hypothetical protein
MTSLSSIFKGDSLKEKVSETRNDFHQARTEYELAMRREILNRVNHCPCCFDGFFENVKARLREEALQNNFEPEVMEILSRMSQIPVVTEEEDETGEVIGDSENEYH